MVGERTVEVLFNVGCAVDAGGTECCSLVRVGSGDDWHVDEVAFGKLLARVAGDEVSVECWVPFGVEVGGVQDVVQHEEW